MTEKQIQYALRNYFSNCFCLNNYYIKHPKGSYEADFVALRNTNYAVEVEIKRSIYDLKKDKQKDHSHDSPMIAELYFAVTEDIYEKSIEHIPENAGIIVVSHVAFSKTYLHVSVRKRPKRNPNCRKWTEEEIKQFYTYSNYHLWSAIKQISKLQNKLKSYDKPRKRRKN